MFTDPKTGYHKHKCEKCEERKKCVIWEHPRPPHDLSDEMNERAHTCPVCGEEEWYKYGGKEKTTHPFNGWGNLPEKGIGGTGTKNKTKCNRNCKSCQFSSIDKLIDQILLSFD